MKLRKSLVMAYYQCPYAAYLSFVKKVPYKPSPEMLAGTEMHKKFEDFYDNIDKLDIKEVTNPQEVQQKFESILPNEEKYKNFAKMEALRLRDTGYDIKKWKPLYREKKISLDNPPKWCLDFGTVDRIDAIYEENGDVEYAVLDYKSYKKYDTTKIRFELCMYKFLIDESHLLPKPIKYIGAIFPKIPEVFFEEIKPQTIKATKKKVIRVREAIEGGHWEKKIGFLCDWCRFRDICLSEEGFVK